ncbi:cobyrinic acid a,c-diamide synthase [Scopulibacillus daqui]|uniref:Cobyrinate a,c-diamide synthase n=1 Tax=Scopulibacillus daqui TaxID=1469162 RepID=A0ABS2PYR3_9BACL|nr:cobyrinate a,c-diamide synthase [Scopulibacillus daqui]MBM7645177.1 cobyrinic acid a,c-diamide synthase [Scopulibacillus daqui]
MQPRLVIAGTGSGVGKTTITIGIMAALKKRGMRIQGFKCGPDYIDPSYHTAVTDRDSRNLDSWMVEKELVKEIFVHGSIGADLSVIEGVMGLYDGRSPENNDGSTAEISALLKAPVILIVDISAVARSVAAIVKGFQALDTNVNIAGVILNYAGSPGHAKLAKTAIEQACGIPVFGYLLKHDCPEIPERHLGLIPAIGRGELDRFFDQLGQIIEEKINLEKLIALAHNTSPVQSEEKLFSDKKIKPPKKVRIAVAKDAAFNFYYQENLELLEQEGAEIIFFSPLSGETLPEAADGLYLGGGFPEEFAAELSEHIHLRAELRKKIEGGLPALCECGGFMFLSKSITTTSGETYPMAGVIPGKVRMQKHLSALGYRDVMALKPTILLDSGEKARGHEFHYSAFFPDDDIPYVYEVKGLGGAKKEGYYLPNLVSGYTHLHFASNPNIAKRWVQACAAFSRLNKG